MNKTTKYFAHFLAPGAFIAKDWFVEVATNDPHQIEWPENAYAFRLYRQHSIEDDGKVYAGKKERIGKMYYHPDSKIETLEEARHNPNATEILIKNMESNGWDRIIWKRWGNWPQPMDSDIEVLK